jgi:hypothetical protein
MGLSLIIKIRLLEMIPSISEKPSKLVPYSRLLFHPHKV